MSGRYFGTDGIRGRANQFPMTAEVAMKVGMAAGMSFQRGNHRHRVVVGKDTRLSGYMLENAMVAGFCPAISCLISSPVSVSYSSSPSARAIHSFFFRVRIERAVV